jgi:hypothetical protein
LYIVYCFSIFMLTLKTFHKSTCMRWSLFGCITRWFTSIWILTFD